jgi:membrane-associated phospholipid phosphatase
MTDAEVDRLARLLAAHAILLLGLGILAALAALAAVSGALRLVGRYSDLLRRASTRLVEQARRLPVVDRLSTRAGALWPSAYVVVHLTLGLVATIAITVFVVIAEDVGRNGAIAVFDAAFANALHATATPGWLAFFSAVSWLGTRAAIAVVTLLVAIRLTWEGNGVLAWGWVAAQAGGGLLNLALKHTFERTRPDAADPLLAATSWSFPSGHAMGTFILCGLGCYMLLRRAQTPSAAGLMVTLSLTWCVVMGFSRLYLGVHFASDVLAGAIAGAAWVAVCASAFEMIRRSKRLPSSYLEPSLRPQ